MFNSNIASISRRATIILGSMTLVWYLLFSAYFVTAKTTGLFYSQNIKPFEKKLMQASEAIIKSFEDDDPFESGKEAESVYIESTSEVNVNVDNSLKTATEENSVNSGSQDQYEYQYYVQPTYAYPTIAPGAPGSREWEEQFWKDWNEKGEYIDKMNAEVKKSQEETLKKFEEMKNN